MKATLITENNQDLFFESLPASVLDENDLFIGAFDEETDTACVCTRERKKGKTKADSVLDFLSHRGFIESGAEVFTTYVRK